MSVLLFPVSLTLFYSEKGKGIAIDLSSDDEVKPPKRPKKTNILPYATGGKRMIGGIRVDLDGKISIMHRKKAKRSSSSSSEDQPPKKRMRRVFLEDSSDSDASTSSYADDEENDSFICSDSDVEERSSATATDNESSSVWSEWESWDGDSDDE